MPLDRETGASSDSAHAGDAFFGRMSGPTGSSYVRGLCGDEMEFYLHIEGNVIRDVKYYTEGCGMTVQCGRAVAESVKGREVIDALAISPRQIIDSLEGLPENGRHCAILAVSALYRAVADFLLMP